MRNHAVYFFIFLSVITFLVGCNKPDPNPERADAIYQDIQSELALARKNIEEAKKKVEGAKANIGKVVPQTGQIRYAEKRYWEAVGSLDLFIQQEKYWIVREEQRRLYVRKRSLKSFYSGEKWSDPKELKEYLDEKRLRAARVNWDVRKRREEYEKQLKGATEPPKEGHH